MAVPTHGFSGVRSGGNPDLDRLRDAVKQAFDTLAQAVSAALTAAVASAKAGVWTTMAVPFHDDMRKLAGDASGQKGPRALIVAGQAAYFDGGQGVYAWDPASVLADNDTTVIGKFATAGRWRKV